MSSGLIPKRKPLPISKQEPPPIIPPEPVDPKQQPQPLTSTWSQKWSHLPQRKRRLLLAALLLLLCLLALIIGLAVGLTVGKKASNLPLPTSHGGPYEGDLTYYDPALGSCGITSSGSEAICAVSHVLFDAASIGSNPNENPLCGLKLRLRRGKKSVDVKIVDRCVGCKVNDIDVSRSVFSDLADMALGRVLVEWAWLEDSPVAM
ncbi:hypothetical protein FE257_006652 [Aspergillus nanangensis]|uniref:RlpA-like double-psi beta-barrel-protein domain-containing protein-containing protein n=1 Tax=Aspergillus nanangensis TaxID=2582783 RepID=A0AAD4GZ68_ASPNN|nr:hypothetical protein FE257_006652 [Aspergillus nanangensis]